MTRAAFLFLILITLAGCQKEVDNAGSSDLQEQSLNDVPYGTDPKQKMDLYLPAGRSDTTKMIIMVHGGGWVEGDKADFTQYFATLKQRLPGYAIANINYRLATSTVNHFPAQENDMKAAIDFLVQKGSEYHISQKFVLLGASAGAHMALLHAYKYSTPRIRAVVDFFGPADMTLFYNSSALTMQFALQVLLGGSPVSNASMYQQSSPVNFVNAQSPPTLILHGDMDVVVPLAQSNSLKNKLQTSAVVHQLVIYPGLGHDIWPAATMNDAFNRIEAFIKTNVP